MIYSVPLCKSQKGKIAEETEVAAVSDKDQRLLELKSNIGERRTSASEKTCEEATHGKQKGFDRWIEYFKQLSWSCTDVDVPKSITVSS